MSGFGCAIRRALTVILYGLSGMLLSACSQQDPHPNTLILKAPAGSHHRYDIAATVTIHSDQDSLQQQLNMDMRADYQRLDHRDKTTLKVTPRYLHVHGAGMHIDTSRMTRSDLPDGLASLLDDGLTIKLDLQQGHLLSVTTHDDAVNRRLRELTDDLVMPRNTLFHIPTILAPLPAQQGASNTVVLPAGQATATVTRLTPHQATIVVASPAPTEQHPNYTVRVLVIDRQTGWLLSMSQVARQYQYMAGHQVRIEQRLVMSLASPFGHRLPRLLTDPTALAQPPLFNAYPDFPLPTHASTRAAALPTSTGMYLSGERRYTDTPENPWLNYPVPEGTAQQIRFDDLRAVVKDPHSERRKTVKLEMDQRTINTAPTIVGLRILPHYWHAKVAHQLAHIEQWQATAHYYPVQCKDYELPVSSSQTTTIEAGDNRVELTPVPEQPHSFWLRFYETSSSQFAKYDIPELVAAQSEFYGPFPMGPSYLTAVEQQQLNIGAMQFVMKVHFDEATPLPKQLTLHQLIRAKAPTFTRTIHFLPPS